MKELTDDIKASVNDVQNYIESRIDLAKIEFTEKTVDGSSYAIASLIIFGFALVFLIIFSVFASMLFASMFNDNYIAGFGIVSGIWFIILLLAFACRNSLIINRIKSSMLDSYLKSLKDE